MLAKTNLFSRVFKVISKRCNFSFLPCFIPLKINKQQLVERSIANRGNDNQYLRCLSCDVIEGVTFVKVKVTSKLSHFLNETRVLRQKTRVVLKS